MTDILTLIHTTPAPAKPDHGAPCNGCGLCCAAEPCGVAVMMIGADPEHGPCPALEHDGGKFVCGLIVKPSRHSSQVHPWADELVGQMVAATLGAGRGCDSDAPAITAAQFLAGGAS